MARVSNRRGSTLGMVLAGVGLFIGGGLIGLVVASGARSSDNPPNQTPPAVSPNQSTQTPQGGAPVSTAAQPVQPTLGLPPIVFEPERIDLGIMSPGQLASGTTNVRNTGDKPLTIAYTKASCKCTSVNLANTVLEPGGSVALTAEYEANSMPGEKTNSVRVLIDGYDPAYVQVFAEVAMTVRASPAYIDAQHQLQGEIRIDSLDGKPFELLSLGGEPPRFLDFNPATDEPRDAYYVQWDLRDYDPASCVDEYGRPMPPWLVVETSHPEAPIFDIIVRHECTRPRPERGQTWVLDRRAMLGVVAAGEPVDVEVQVKMLNTATHHEPIRSIKSLSPNFSAEIVSRGETIDRETTYTMRITPAANFQGILFGEVAFSTTGFTETMHVIAKVQ